MKAIRRINNNVIVVLDEKGNEIIARGKGIGFHDFPYDVDLKDIERTYYNIDKEYFEMIDEIPDEIIDISTRIIDFARERMGMLEDSNIVFTLADHINFAIKRYKENVPLTLPITNDIQYLLKDEYQIGLYGIELVRKQLNIFLPKDEAAYIALHTHEIISNHSNKMIKAEEEIIADIISIIEDSMKLSVNQEDFNYSRFVSHMHYLLRRKEDLSLSSNNDVIYGKLIEEYPLTHKTSEKIAVYLKENSYPELNNDEKMYLMLHINRLCTREMK